jgi:hypothetical protein
VATTHGLVEDCDGERVPAVVVEDDEVADHNFMGAAEPPLTAG